MPIFRKCLYDNAIDEVKGEIDGEADFKNMFSCTRNHTDF